MIDKISADWILPVSSPPIKNGNILIERSRKKISGFSEPKSEVRDTKSMDIKHLKGYAIMPALVNAHTHLFYSAFDVKSISKESFKNWMEEVISFREKYSFEAIASSMHSAANEMYRKGVSLVGNICSDFFNDGEEVEKSLLKGVNFLEWAGFSQVLAEKFEAAVLKLGEKNRGDGKFKYIPSPHSIYSCDSNMIKRLRVLSEQRKLPFSIHLAESKAESDLLEKNTGELKAYLSGRGMPDDFLKHQGISPAMYLDAVGGLFERTLAVHCVYLNDEDIELISRRRAGIVTCPGSNRFLGNGIAPLEKFLDKKITIAIGTDSSASNEELDLFREMRILKEEHSAIHSSDIIKMATKNGAKLLGLDNDYGTIEKDKTADLIALPLPGEAKEWGAGEVEDYIVKECSGNQVERIVV